MQEVVYSYVFPDIKPSLKVSSNTYNFTLCPKINYVASASESCVTLYKTSAFYLFPWEKRIRPVFCEGLKTYLISIFK